MIVQIRRQGLRIDVHPFAGSERQRNVSRPTVRALGVGLLLALALTACGNDEEQSTVMKFVTGVQKDLQQKALPGAVLVKKKCLACHYVDKNMRKTGPSLKGIVGRAPSIQDVPFERWDEQSLDQWLTDPTGIKPGTSMVMEGLKSAQERSDIIAYLKQL